MMFKVIGKFFGTTINLISIGCLLAVGMRGMDLVLPKPKHELKVIVCYADEIDTVEMCRPLETLRQNTSANGAVKIQVVNYRRILDKGANTHES